MILNCEISIPCTRDINWCEIAKVVHSNIFSKNQGSGTKNFVEFNYDITVHWSVSESSNTTFKFRLFFNVFFRNLNRNISSVNYF